MKKQRTWVAWLAACAVGVAFAAEAQEKDGEVAAEAAAPKAKPASQKKGPRFTAVEQSVVDRVLKQQPDAVFRALRNKFCPITGKLADPSVPPLDSPQKFRHEHILVAVAEAGLMEKIAASVPENRLKDFMRDLASAAQNNMRIHMEGTGKNAIREARRLDLPPEQRAPAPAPKDVDVALTVDAGTKHQTIDGFGTATYAHNRNTWETYAKPEYPKMIAEDLGLSMIRFPLAPAFFETVEKPEQITREKFLFEGDVPNAPVNAKGRTTAKTTRGVLPCLEFISKLVKINPEIRVIASVWSPPHWMKTSNAQAGGGSLKPEYYAHFAQYLVEWIRFVREKYGLDLYAVSPQNELAFSEPYDSCIYKPADYARLLGVIGEVFAKEKIEVKVFGPEDMTKVLGRTMSYVKAIQDDPAAAARLDIIATHGYSDGIQLTGSASENSEFWNAIKGYGKPYWMTETGTGAADNRWTDGGPDGKTLEVDKKGHALGLVQGAFSSVAGRLHYALVYGNASGWTFWQITGPSPSVHALMQDDKPDNKYYVAKHYWRWIRPGAVRIEAGPDGGEKGVNVSAFQHERNRTVTIVVLNRSDDNARVSIALKTDVPVASFETWRSSETEQCAAQPATPVADGRAALTLPPRSMVTLFGAAPAAE